MRVPQVSERIKEAPAQALRGVFAGIGQLLLLTDKLRKKAHADRDVLRARTPGAAGTATDTTVTSPAADAQTVPAANGAAPAANGVASAAAAPAEPPAGVSAAGAGAQETASAKPAATRRAPAKPATPKPATRPATTRRAPAKPATGKPTTAKPATGKPAAGKPAAKPATTRRAAAKPAAAEAADEAPKPSKRQSTRDFDKTGNVRLIGGEDAPPLPNYDELSVASLRARLRNLDVAQVKQLTDYERAHAARAEVLTMFERRVAKLEAEA